MTKRTLTIPSTYDPQTQHTVGLFAAQLDDQLKLLKAEVKDLTIEHLEWQLRPGMNTVGMLLAHLAIVEVFWISLAAEGIDPGPNADQVLQGRIGIGMDDDGLPLSQDGGHPKTLKGRPFSDYATMLDRARVAVHGALRTWFDRDLEKTFIRRDRSISRMWTLYHVLEHFAGHFGQILLLKHMMRDASLLPPEGA